jgi:hypothetical protein
MFPDPQTITVNAVAVPLPRTKAVDGLSEYISVDGNTKLTIKQTQSATRFRREARISFKKIAPDPIGAANVNKEVSLSVYYVMDEPKWGFSDVELDYYSDALKTLIIDSFTNRLFGGEL